MKRKTRAYLSVLLAAALLSIAVGAAFAETGALPSGIDDAHIAQTIDAYVAEHRDTTAAVATAVIRGQDTLFEKTYGYANRETDVPADAETVYEWGSVTKLLVWVSAMQLAEQGLLDLDRDISVYLPRNFLTKLRYDQKITFMNLMHHNAGFEETIVDLFVPYTAATGDLEHALLKSMPRQLFEPGAVVGYSNWGVALAGFIIERISGLPFYAYVRQHVFAPLGMENTALHPTLQDNERVLAQRGLVQGYFGTSPAAGTQLSVPLYPAGMATGTLGDFITFAKALLPDEGETSPLFQKAETLGALLTPSLFYGGSAAARNSHGFWSLQFGVTALGHG
ncbi:MAG: beta-lactamase family protein, partial [Clostridia bacterium]|nr:beta-lactamase family protein [Clostridia bacterium]